MTIPLLEYTPSVQNQRVDGYEVPGDEQPRVFTTTYLASASEMDDLIAAAYRQLFNEQQMTRSSRQLVLESQLRAGQITVKQFIRGLVTSDLFRSRNYDTNSNYRFVQMCVQRLLGREVYSDREKLAWSTVLATQGLHGLIDALLDSQEYQANFGEHTVPYQRRRILPQRSQGALPFARMARYDAHYRDSQPQGRGDRFARFQWGRFLQQADGAVVAGLVLAGSGIIIAMLLLATTVANP